MVAKWNSVAARNFLANTTFLFMLRYLLQLAVALPITLIASFAGPAFLIWYIPIDLAATKENANQMHFAILFVFTFVEMIAGIALGFYLLEPERWAARK